MVWRQVEAVENHMPEIIIVDEIGAPCLRPCRSSPTQEGRAHESPPGSLRVHDGCLGWCCAGTEAEALACRSIAERGVQLVATAHGQLLENLIKVRGRCDSQHPYWHLLAVCCSEGPLSAPGVHGVRADLWGAEPDTVRPYRRHLQCHPG